MTTTRNKNMTLEKPHEIADNIKMFIKVGKAVYKVIVWFNDKIASYEVQEKSIEKINPLSIEYRRFLRQNPKIKDTYKHQMDCKILGKTVK